MGARPRHGDFDLPRRPGLVGEKGGGPNSEQAEIRRPFLMLLPEEEWRSSGRVNKRLKMNIRSKWGMKTDRDVYNGHDAMIRDTG